MDSGLAALDGVPTQALNQAVKRNAQRFPPGFVFELRPDEADALRSQVVTPKPAGHGGRRTLPKVFTEHGASMAAVLLK